MQQEQSAQQEGSAPAAGMIPTQRSGAAPRRGAHRAEAKVPAESKSAPVPKPPDETVVLPAFITGKGRDKEPEPEPASPGRPESDDGPLPASERGMLIFVAALLGVGTLAVVVVLGLGGFSAPPPQPAAAATVSAEPSPLPSPSPSVSPSPAPSPSPTPKRSTSPARVTLGTLTANDPRAFCAANNAGKVRQHEDRSWYCSGSSSNPPLPFSSTDVCRWRYLKKTAYAVAVNIDDPTTWKCYV